MKEEKLLGLLQKKRGFFEAIYDLCETEEHLSLSEWVTVLKQKKVLLSCIDEIDAELHAFKDAFSHLSQDISEELDALRHLIEKILHLDSSNQEKRKQEIAKLWEK